MATIYDFTHWNGLPDPPYLGGIAYDFQVPITIGTSNLDITANYAPVTSTLLSVSALPSAVAPKMVEMEYQDNTTEPYNPNNYLLFGSAPCELGLLLGHTYTIRVQTPVTVSGKKYAFTNWTGNATGTDFEITLANVQAPIILVAHFMAVVTLTFTALPPQTQGQVRLIVKINGVAYGDPVPSGYSIDIPENQTGVTIEAQKEITV
jgi:hypothetical protein